MEAQDSKFCQCLYYSSQALARAISQLADEVFAKVGLTTSYAYLLMAVHDLPGIQPMAISKELNLTPSTITRLVEKMETKRWLRRETEGKTTKVYLTEEGAANIENIKQCWCELNQQYATILGETESHALSARVLEASKLFDASLK
jgi:MarR family transcriptional regulator, organic hydroperoxide resistance regulator